MRSGSNVQGVTGCNTSHIGRVLDRFAAGGGDVGFGKLGRAGDSKQSALFAADQPTSWPYMSHS